MNSKNVNLDVRGVGKPVVGNAATNIDLKLNDDSYLTGVRVLVKNASWGDTCDMQVVDVDGILKGVAIPGMGGVTYDQVPGYPVLAQYVTGYWMSDADTRQGDLDSPYPAKISAGLYLRAVYRAVASMNSTKAAFNYVLHKALNVSV
jgi:hypothetical protein